MRLEGLVCVKPWLSSSTVSQSHKSDLTSGRYLQYVPLNTDSVARFRVKKAKKILVKIILPACCISVSFFFLYIILLLSVNRHLGFFKNKTKPQIAVLHL